MKNITIINGPNLNLLGVREPEKYGNTSFESFFKDLKIKYSKCKIDYFQSNSESEIIDKIHQIGFSSDGIILNAAAYTHTSVAIADAVAAVSSPVIEVHITNTAKREEFRHKSYLSKVCVGVVMGFGLKSYEMAMSYFLD